MREFKSFRGVGAAITQITKSPGSEFSAKVALFSKHSSMILTDSLPIDYRESDCMGTAPWDKAIYDARGIDKTGKPFPGMLSPTIELDCYGLTSLGPLEALPYGQYVGAVFLEDSHFTKLSTNGHFSGSEWEAVSVPSYRYRSIVYSPDSGKNGVYAGRRYIGFHAIVVEQRPKSLIVKIFGNPNAKHIEFVLDDPLHCSPDGPLGGGETLLKLTNVTDDEGALYVEQRRAADLGLRGPKLPTGMGE